MNPMDFSISLNGVQTAEQNFNQAAQKIAAANLPSSESPDRFELTDFAAELIAADQAKFAVEANLRVISTQTELEHETLNLFA
jgi:hypothetical protein